MDGRASAAGAGCSMKAPGARKAAPNEAKANPFASVHSRIVAEAKKATSAPKPRAAPASETPELEVLLVAIRQAIEDALPARLVVNGAAFSLSVDYAIQVDVMKPGAGGDFLFSGRLMSVREDAGFPPSAAVPPGMRAAVLEVIEAALPAVVFHAGLLYPLSLEGLFNAMLTDERKPSAPLIHFRLLTASPGAVGSA